MADYYLLKTLGCKANLYDSQLIEAELRKRGWLPWLGGEEAGGGAAATKAPRLCIVNSCTVTDEADRQSRKLASRLSRENPEARVVVTGCGAEVDPERLARSTGIHYVVGNQDKPAMVELILRRLEDEKRGPASSEPASSAAQAPEPAGVVLGSVLAYGELLSRHPMDREWPLPEQSFAVPPVAAKASHTEKTRAFLKIQEGCNSFCTYCIIPYGRGPSRSLHPDQVVAHARAVVAQGAREIVVTGTNIGDYGVDWGMGPEESLPGLFKRLLNETGLARLRVGSLDPAEITDGLLGLMEGDARFCPHFHVSLQAAHPRILKLMKRKYGLELARDRLRRIAGLGGAAGRAGGPFIGMDVITGFPGETDEMFEESLEELARLPWSRLHVFPYSEREGTPATRLPGAVPRHLRAERAKRLASLSLERAARHAARTCAEGQATGGLERVLLEKPSAQAPRDALRWLQACGEQARGELLWANGYTPNYLRVWVPLEGAQARELRNREVAVLPLGTVTEASSGEVGLAGRLRSSG